MDSSELDIEAIEQEFVLQYWGDTVKAQQVIRELINEVRELRKENERLGWVASGWITDADKKYYKRTLLG